MTRTRLRDRQRQARGFGLIEVLVAQLLVGLGILGLISLQTSLWRSATTAEQHYQALTLARSLIAEVRFDPDALVNGGERELNGAPGYRVRWQRTAQAASDTDRLRVDIVWRDRGRPRELTLTTLIDVTDPHL